MGNVAITHDVTAEPALTPDQLKAATVLGAGGTAIKAAEAAGVARVTVWRWTRLAAFAAHVARLKAEHRAALADDVDGLAPDAIAALRKILRDGSATAAASVAVAVLKHCGILRTDPPTADVENAVVNLTEFTPNADD